MMSMMNGGGMVLWMVLQILFFGLVIYGVITLVMRAFEKKEDSALKILRERFAKGEIAEEEYEQRSQFLRNNNKS